MAFTPVSQCRCVEFSGTVPQIPFLLVNIAMRMAIAS